MKIDVPYQQQQTGGDCVIAGTSMLLSYYRIPHDYADLMQKYPLEPIGDSTGGTYMPQVAIELLEHGLAVDFVTLNPFIFTIEHQKLSQSEIQNHLQSLRNDSAYNNHKHVIDYFLKFLDAGGTITVKIPTVQDIRQELANKSPVGFAGTTMFFLSDKPDFNSHFALIVGEENDKFLIQDPHKIGKNKTGNYTISRDELIYGLYSSAHFDMDNALIMRVREK